MCVAAAGWVWALTVPVSGWAWVADLAANVAVWSVVLGLVAACWASGRVRCVLGVLAVLQALLIAVWVVPGRAARLHGHGPGLRVVQFNAHTERDRPELVLEYLRGSGADVVAMTEAPRELLEFVRTDPGLMAAFPYRDVPPWDLSNTRLLLSRWPIEVLLDRPSLARGDPHRGLRLVRVHHEDGPFVALTLHPRSPRTPARWREGNVLLGSAIGLVGERAPGEPLVVLADLNSTPTGGRSRRLCAELGLRRCMPLMSGAGTYPSGWPWPFSLAIDDAWVSAGWGVASWRTVSGLGSDHRAVEVELVRAE